MKSKSTPTPPLTKGGKNKRNRSPFCQREKRRSRERFKKEYNLNMYYKYLAGEFGRSKNGNLKYLDELKTMARQYRNNPTKSEQIFWNEVLQYDKIKYRFLRQKPINKYILDFYCSKLLLAIEIDGDSHDAKKYLDNERDIFLEKYRIVTIRYTNNQVLNELNKIKDNLNKIIKEREKLVFESVSLLSKGETAKPRGI